MYHSNVDTVHSNIVAVDMWIQKWVITCSEESTWNWCFKDGTISFQEIFDLCRRHCSGRLLRRPLDPTSSAMLSAWHPFLLISSTKSSYFSHLHTLVIFNQWLDSSWSCMRWSVQRARAPCASVRVCCSDHHTMSGCQCYLLIREWVYLSWKVRCHWKMWGEMAMGEGGKTLQYIM